jgi:cytochrome c peroxidase
MKQQLTLFFAFLFLVVACQPEDETAPGTTPYETGPLPELFGGVPEPKDNPTTVQGVALGRMLFYEKRLSGDNTISCASCHQQKFAFTDGGKAVSSGITGINGTRSTMSLTNLAWQKIFMWDARDSSLEKQGRGPVQNPIEMHQNLSRVVNKLQNTETYPEEFFKAFGSKVITEEAVFKALAQFERTLISSNSKYDMNEREPGRYFNAQERAGQALFNIHPYNKPPRGANCFDCHGGAHFNKNLVTNNGLDMAFNDPGLGGVTGNASDMGKFKAPTLRNIALTAPYMHDGRFKTLEEVLDHYNEHVEHSSPTLDPQMTTSNLIGNQPQLGLTPQEKEQVIAFLKTLTDSTFITDPRFSDPFEKTGPVN